MKILKQSTVATVIVGPVLDANGAAVTTAVVGDFRISKNGTPATLSGATVAHDANGYYTIALTTSNTDTVGRLEIYSGNTAQATAVHNWLVLLASVFDALQTNATNSTGGLVTATGSVTALAGAISTLTAAGVRTELATELARIDATISSRLPTALYTTPPTVAQVVTGVYAAQPADHTVSGSYGVRFLLALNTNRIVQVTGSNHIAADVHEFQADVITAAALAASAVTEIQAGLATAANLLIVSDRVSYSLAVLVGACSDAQTAAETYTLSIGGNTFTVDYTGLDSSGNRSTTTLSKT
jgi:hypothetical protein